jgi:hypothetical protein
MEVEQKKCLLPDRAQRVRDARNVPAVVLRRHNRLPD